MRINLTTDDFTEVTITSGTLQNISPQASVEVASTATKNTGIILPPYATLSYSDNATVYARNAWDDDSTCVIAVEPFKRGGEGGEYTLPIATASKLGGVKVGSNLSIDESGVLSSTGGGAVNYSITEQQIGTWIDGKPLYQITIQDTMPTVTTEGTRATKEIDVSSLSINKCVSIHGFIFKESDWDSRPLNSINNNGQFSYCSVGKANSSSVCADDLFIASSRTTTNGAACFITIRYTKTTD